MQVKQVIGWGLVALIVMVGGCRSTPETEEREPVPQDSQTINGTVRHIPLEGGFYGIVADDGRHYDPVNLPVEFRQDGLSVTCRIRPARNHVSFRMWGQLVEIVDIQRR